MSTHLTQHVCRKKYDSFMKHSLSVLAIVAILSALFTSAFASVACAQDYSTAAPSGGDSGEIFLIVGILAVIGMLGKALNLILKLIAALGIILLLIVLL